jgi:hypothetical protein
LSHLGLPALGSSTLAPSEPNSAPNEPTIIRVVPVSPALAIGGPLSTRAEQSHRRAERSHDCRGRAEIAGSRDRRVAVLAPNELWRAPNEATIVVFKPVLPVFAMTGPLGARAERSQRRAERSHEFPGSPGNDDWHRRPVDRKAASEVPKRTYDFFVSSCS